MLYTFYKTYGNKILFRYRIGRESHTKIIDFYNPSIFIPTENQEEASCKSIYGEILKQRKYDTIKDWKESTKTLSESGIRFYGNRNPAQQFVIELNQGKDIQFNIEDIRYCILDIEVNCKEGFPEPEDANWPINAIAIYDSYTDTYYCYGDKPFDPVGDKDLPEGINVEFIKCENETDLLVKMLEHFREKQYDMTVGWNSEKFDMPYIVNRCMKILGETATKQLSPFGIVNTRHVTTRYGQEFVVDIMGLPHVDFMDLYKKYSFTPQESYKLGNVADSEVGEDKLSYEEEGSLFDLYEKNPQKFYSYNIRDVYLIKKINEKRGMIELCFVIGYYTYSNFEDALGTVKIWENLTSKFLYNRNVVPLFKQEDVEWREFEGAFVKEVEVGMHEDLLSIDLNSLYPHIEMQSGIGNETYIPREKLPKELLELRSKYTLDDLVYKRADLSALKKYNVSMTCNFEFYRKDITSFFSDIKKALYQERKIYKNKMKEAEGRLVVLGEDQKELKEELERLVTYNDVFQLALKLILNGGYGALSNQHFLYFKIQNAEAITMTGQVVNRWTAERLVAFLKDALEDETHKYWVAGDTDSCYLSLKPLRKFLPKDQTVDQWVDSMDKFHKTVLAPKIKEITDELAYYLNSVENKMVWEREVISDKAIFVAKKKYAMMVRDNEGTRYPLDKPKFKFVGLEAIKSAYPMWARDYLKECYKICLTKDEHTLQRRVKEISKEFYKLDPRLISIPRGVNGIEKYTDKETGLYIHGTQKHIKSAILHNYLVDKLNLHHIQKIKSGTKIKYIDLKKANPLGHDVIGFESYLPKEFGLDNYIDRESIFDSSFMSPMRIFLKALNWSEEEEIKLF